MPVKLGVQTTVGDQLLMITVFGDAPAVEHQHPIGLLHRGQAMGNDQAATEKVHALQVHTGVNRS